MKVISRHPAFAYVAPEILTTRTRTQMHESVPYLDLPAQIRALRPELDAAIARTLDKCSFCLGPDTAQFEKDFAKFCGAEHCIRGRALYASEHMDANC